MRSARLFAERLLLVCACLSLAGRLHAQTITQRGFLDLSALLFVQEAPNDSTLVVGDFVAREEVFAKWAPWIQVAAGVDLRANSHDQVEDSWRLDAADRGALRPRLSLRRATATMTRGGFAIDVGKQFIRWGKTDIVTPTDRFAPRDFLDVVDNEFLAVTGVRASVQASGDSIEVVWVPRFTPSRIPLVNQRWTAVSEAPAPFSIVDRGAELPTGSQAGARWSHVGDGIEYALSFFDGFNHLPSIDVAAGPMPFEIAVTRVYPRIHTFGADVAMPTRWFTIKGETAYFTAPDSAMADEFVLYVIQLERQTGEWVLLGGYAGEIVTERRAGLTFAPDRGMTESIIGRASYTIDTNRSAAFECAVRQTGAGEYVKVEYSQTRGQHWRTTIAGVALGGHSDDFLGQYHRNSHLSLTVRYSF